MSQPARIVVVGSHAQGLFMRVQRIPQPDETVLGWDYREALDGGKGSHMAIACARLGVSTSFVGCVGRDHFGEVGIGWMREAGVDLTHLKRSETTHTGVGFVVIDPAGTPAISVAMGANAQLTQADIDAVEPLIAQAQILLTVFEIPSTTALYAARLARKHSVTTILTPAPVTPLAAEDLADIDILVPNQIEARTLLGMETDTHVSAETLGRECQQRFGVPRLIITQGKHGATVIDHTKSYHCPALNVPVADTPGAGDAFVAGLAVGLTHHLPLAAAVRLGSVVAAHAVTIKESIPAFPTLAQLKQFMLMHHVDDIFLK